MSSCKYMCIYTYTHIKDLQSKSKLSLKSVADFKKLHKEVAKQPILIQ